MATDIDNSNLQRNIETKNLLCDVKSWHVMHNNAYVQPVKIAQQWVGMLKKMGAYTVRNEI